MYNKPKQNIFEEILSSIYKFFSHITYGILRFFSKLYPKYSAFTTVVLRYIYKSHKSWVFIFSTGAIGGFAYPPIGLFFILPFCFSIFLRLMDFATTKKSIAKVSILFNLGYCTTVFYWPAHGALTFGYSIYIVPFFAIGLIILASIVPSILIYFYGLMNSTIHKPMQKILFFASMWVLSEYIRSFVVFHFPFGLVGYTVGNFPSMFQLVSIFGVLGLSFTVVLWSCSFYLILLIDDKIKFISYFRAFTLINLCWFLIILAGYFRIKEAKNEYFPYKAALVQGNTNVEQTQPEIYNIYKDITKKIQNATNGDIDIIIWPENGGTPFDLEHKKNESISEIKKFMLPHQTFIFNDTRINNERQIFNTMYVYENNKIQFHDKKYLVPYGEYLPIIQKYSFGKAMARNAGIGFTSGKEIVTQITRHGKFTPLICYESTYSGYIINNKITPDYMVNITNDEWLGLTSGPFQHFIASQYRAVEEGIAVVRVANSGKSAIIDPFGISDSKTTSLFKKDVIISLIPKPLKTKTLFSLWGNIPILAIIYIITQYYFFLYQYESNKTKFNTRFTEIFHNFYTKKHDPDYKRRY